MDILYAYSTVKNFRALQKVDPCISNKSTREAYHEASRALTTIGAEFIMEKYGIDYKSVKQKREYGFGTD